jgi:hypothetical protein
MNVNFRLSLIALFSGAITLTGCTPVTYIPQFDDATLHQKQREISNLPIRFPQTGHENPSIVLSRIYERLEPVAKEACIANGEKWLNSSCSNWKVKVADDDSFNAYATAGREIVFTTEVFKYTRSDDELAFILAHEMGHHVLNHMMEDIVNAEIMGATTGLLSAILMGAIAGGLGASEDTVADLAEEAMEDGWESGRQSGRLLYSVDQESEADNFALQIIKLAGYSQAEARNILLYIGTNSSELRSDHNTTHPTGPERIAAFDLYASLTSDRSYSVSTSSNSVVTKKIKHTYPTGGYESDLIQVKLNFSTAYSSTHCMYKHADQWVALNVHEVPRRVCPERIGWPKRNSDLVFDRTQGGTIPLLGVSLKLSKGRNNANICAYKIKNYNGDMLIPKGTRAVCPKTYAY